MTGGSASNKLSVSPHGKAPEMLEEENKTPINHLTPVYEASA